MLKTRMEVLASVARTASGTKLFSIPRKCASLFVQLDVESASSDSGDILATWVQGTVDGSNFFDIGRFADVLGNGGAKRYIMVLQRGGSIAESDLITPTDGLMAAGAVNYGPFPDDLRLKWTVTDAGDDNASFTFSVTASIVY